MKKQISERNLNAMVASDDIDKALIKMGVGTYSKRVYLVKLILRDSPTHRIKTKIPVIAFAKAIGSKLAVKVLATGAIALLDDTHIRMVSEVQGDFSINNVFYTKKDTINGYLRYKVKNA